mmetsp:Transcript_8149/g.13036  ORF Transcript_8149/g.13036 Transcript_8149/m.13036 type:complete len:624 (+) Transcript_8149:74-1945(+)
MDRQGGYGNGNRSEGRDTEGNGSRKRKSDNDDKRDRKKEKNKVRGDRHAHEGNEKHKVKEDSAHHENIQAKSRRDERHAKDDMPPEKRRSKEERSDKNEESHHGKQATHRSPRSISEIAPNAAERSPPPAAVPKAKSKDWREEVGEKDDDERDLSTDEEERERKLVDARKRRQELMSKASLKQTDTTTTPARAEEPSVKEDKSEVAASRVAASSTKEDAKKKQEDSGGGMFDDSAAAGNELLKQVKQTSAIGFTGASGEDWDDEEGYYVPKLDELMDNRYLVQEVNTGKGVYSGVVKAKDRKAGGDTLVAVKVIRANDRMTKAAELEVALLKKLQKADKDGTSMIVRLLDTFVYRKHFCLVFECMWGDLRAALKTLTKNRGMTISAVRSYSKQLLSALKHMLHCKIIHCDIKPDNILISKSHSAVKFCDLGTAVEISGVNATPYLGSGYYRSPEIVLGCDWGYPVDTWALAATLAEIFTGKVLMPSKTNNQHLKLIMDLKGKIPGKVIKRGQTLVWKNHFTDDLDFKLQEASLENDPETGEPLMITRVVSDLNAKKSIKDILMERVGSEKRHSDKPEDKEYVTRAAQLADLLELMLALDPDKRVNPNDALQHAFCSDLRRKHQ